MLDYWRDMALLSIAQIKGGVDMGATTQKDANDALRAIIEAAKHDAANDKHMKDKHHEH